MADDLGRLPREIDFLVFQAAGVPLAVEASQVTGIVKSLQAAERGISVASLDEILRRSGRAAPAVKDVLLFCDGEKTWGLGIERLDSIQPVSIETIHLMPALLASSGGSGPFWGALIREDKVVLLIDLHRLITLFPCRAAQRASTGGHEQ